MCVRERELVQSEWHFEKWQRQAVTRESEAICRTHGGESVHFAGGRREHASEREGEKKESWPEIPSYVHHWSHDECTDGSDAKRSIWTSITETSVNTWLLGGWKCLQEHDVEEEEDAGDDDAQAVEDGDMVDVDNDAGVQVCNQWLIDERV